MLDLQIQSPKEIWEAKKILYESNSATKRAFIFSLTTLVFYLPKPQGSPDPITTIQYNRNPRHLELQNRFSPNKKKPIPMH
jgi:hypothetical protein